uniref:Lamina-associated polypeptide 2 alpha C-terminal domain-containing protein n=1 Tax=Pelodiscus sinensis TaxID=13735 RepID=K7F182_PELSI
MIDHIIMCQLVTVTPALIGDHRAPAALLAQLLSILSPGRDHLLTYHTLQGPQRGHSDPEEGVSANVHLSFPSPDDAVTSGDTSPPDDLREFQDLFKRVAQSQEVQLSEAQVKQHKLLKNLHPQQRCRIALPSDEAIMDMAHEIWQTPTSIPPTSKRADKYFVPSKDMGFLFNHPQPNSLIVDAARHKNKTSQFRSSLPDKGTRKLDLFGCKMYSSSTLMLRIANYAALLSNHNFDNYAKLPELMQHLPEAKRPLLKAIVQEGYTAWRTLLQIALDVTDTAARAMATGIAMRRASWLMASGAPKELQNKVEDLPFDRKRLFAASTDDVLHSGKDSRTTLRTLGMYTPLFKRRHYYTFQRRYDYTFQKQQQCVPDQPRFRQHPQRKHQ